MTKPTKKLAKVERKTSVKKSLKVMPNLNVAAGVPEVFLTSPDTDDSADDDFTTLDGEEEYEEEREYDIAGGHAPKKRYIGRGTYVHSRGRRYIQNIQRRGSGRITIRLSESKIVIGH